MIFKAKNFISIPLVLILYSNLLYSQSQNPVNNTSVPEQTFAQQKEKLKEILYKLVKQDEYLDVIAEKIEDQKNLTYKNSSEIFSMIKLVKNNLEHISHLNKNEFTNISTNPEISKYTKTIMVYSNKINKKAKKIANDIGSFLAKTKKQMRNAPISNKTKNKGKNIKELLKEQENLKTLNKELLSLSYSSSKVKATSKWLYIASK